MERLVRAPAQLVRRAVLMLAGLTVLSGLTAGVFGLWTIRYELNEAMDAAMEQAAGRIAPFAVETLYGRDEQKSMAAMPRASENDATSLLYQVRNASGRVLLHSHDAPPEPFTKAVGKGFETTDDYRLYTLPVVSQSLFIQMAEPIGQRDEELFEAASGFLVPIALFVPASGLLAWLLANGIFRPVSRLLSEIGDKHGDNLTPIKAQDYPAELGVAVETVNGLMSRLRDALESEREFATNAAHELRTPIAGALAQTERLLAQPLAQRDLRRADRVHSALMRLSRVSENLLQLARAGSGPSDRLSTLGDVAKLVLREYGGDPHGSAKITLTLADGSDPVVRIDQDVLAIALRNLIENALRHGDNGKQIDVCIGPGPRISVVNGGPVVPPDILAELRRRYVRGTSVSDGSGIGLSIVERIVKQSGGELVLCSPAEGRTDGFEARLVFPITSGSGLPDFKAV